jgi:ricin-type beta-trefoil lectin protein
VAIVQHKSTKENVAMPNLIQQIGGRFLDAHEIQERDFNVVTRPFQRNNTQHWRLRDTGGGLWTIQQVSSGRFLDAHEIESLDFRVVTRPEEKQSSVQIWLIFDADRFDPNEG